MNTERVYMLATDHRWQWEAWCRDAGVHNGRISEVKALIFEGFLAAREQSYDVQQHGSVLLDLDYAASQVARAIEAGIPVATPAEKAGVFPLAWGRDSFDEAFPGSCAKVLVRYRPEWPAAERESQFEQLRALQAWCDGRAVTYLVEVVVMREHEPEEWFETTGRPLVVAEVIRAAYARGITPQLWKLEGTSSQAGARMIDEAVAEAPGCRQIILGKAAEPATIERWFEASVVSRTAAGFAIGRSVFWEAGTRYLLGEVDATEVVRATAEGYLALVASWHGRDARV